MSESRPKRIAVLGGGIAGLAAAHRLVTLEPSTEVTLFEAGDKLGGVIQSEHVDGYLIERSADNFITNFPWGVDLCRELGIAEELLETDPARRKALIVRDGRLYPVPAGFQLLTPSQLWPLVTSPLLSLGGKIRILREYFVPPRTDDGDESLESFTVRRLGREAFERLVQPLVGGIYTADPAQLSMQAALPRFLELEKKHGSLIRAARHLRGKEKQAATESSGARYGLFVAPRGGMGRIAAAVAAKLPEGCVKLNSRVVGIERNGDAWQLTLESQDDSPSFDALVTALPAPIAARLLRNVDAELAADVAKIPYAGASIALSGYELKQIDNPLDAFGFVVPAIEKNNILAASFSSRKFPDRAPEGCVLIRTFLGGALRPDLVDLPEAEIRALVGRELGALLGIRGEPHLFLLQRWRGAMPQYHLGHVPLVECIQNRAARLPRLALAGNAYHGVGLPQCVRSGRAAAERLLNA
jgi:oxygen-dependent protoporphyrinogen oxidase